jgi:hypothetical protein
MQTGIEPEVLKLDIVWLELYWHLDVVPLEEHQVP